MTEGLRARKKAETRDALRNAALRLADQVGPEKVTVEAVAEAAGVSPRTFFNYFPSKEAAILSTNPSDDETLLNQLQQRPASEAPLDSLRESFLGVANRLEENPDVYALRQRVMQRHPDLAARWAAYMARSERNLVVEIARRTKLDPDRDTYPAVVVGAGMAAARVALALWQAQPEGRPVRLSALFNQVFDQLAAGLTKPRVRHRRTRPR